MKTGQNYTCELLASLLSAGFLLQANISMGAEEQGCILKVPNTVMIYSMKRAGDPLLGILGFPNGHVPKFLDILPEAPRIPTLGEWKPRGMQVDFDGWSADQKAELVKYFEYVTATGEFRTGSPIATLARSISRDLEPTKRFLTTLKAFGVPCTPKREAKRDTPRRVIPPSSSRLDPGDRTNSRNWLFCQCTCAANDDRTLTAVQNNLFDDFKGGGQKNWAKATKCGDVNGKVCHIFQRSKPLVRGTLSSCGPDADKPGVRHADLPDIRVSRANRTDDDRTVVHAGRQDTKSGGAELTNVVHEDSTL